MNDSTSPDPSQAESYAALVKPGDAIETPDGELWVVDKVLAGQLHLISAYRDAAGRICAEVYEATHTVVPTEKATKVADARQVRR
jgi:hypothetical protein